MSWQDGARSSCTHQFSGRRRDKSWQVVKCNCTKPKQQWTCCIKHEASHHFFDVVVVFLQHTCSVIVKKSPAGTRISYTCSDGENTSHQGWKVVSDFRWVELTGELTHTLTVLSLFWGQVGKCYKCDINCWMLCPFKLWLSIKNNNNIFCHVHCFDQPVLMNLPLMLHPS